ncbi:zinc finger and BTB domain-containing protein 8A-like isoform X2 [Diabrotica virgifera virgifera]|uniref:Zinc finger and BTB domain-containing protein 8A-like isoform X2 n=1 Tax=Diabrotica virgifera virgifera TaxID=50390 RepID=A0A6P7FNV6_DIAVI|nr:zinc finger and BTB domain-containing protein 8A-like isoform X2 [Diabrotica virgifera virgifera]
MKLQKSVRLYADRHYEKLGSIFSDLYKDSLLTDCTLYCKDGSLKAHKVVLAASSRYFRQVFIDHTDDNAIFMYGISYSQLKNLIELMYSGSIDIPNEHFTPVYNLCEELKVSGLNVESTDTKTNGSSRHTRFKGQKRVTVDFENAEDANADPISITALPLTTSTPKAPGPIEFIPSSSADDKATIQPKLENDADLASEKYKSDNSHMDSPSEPESSVGVITDAEGEGGTLSAWARKERKFKCDLCDASFKRASHLNRHQLVHTGERPFACEHCDKAFSRHDKLKHHIHKAHELGALNDALGPDSLYTIDRVDILTPEVMVKSEENSFLTSDSHSVSPFGEPFGEPIQKKRGRPRKYPISTPREYVINPVKNALNPVKKRGRPRKHEAPPKPLIKRPRGRPRLHPNGIGRPASFPQFFPDSFDSVGYMTTKSHHPTLSDLESSQEMIYNSSEMDNNMDQIMMEPLVEIKTEQMDPEIKCKEEDPLPPSTSSNSFFENIGLYENATSAIAKIGECTISVATCSTAGPGHSGTTTTTDTFSF